MQPAHKSRPANLAGRVFAAILLLAVGICLAKDHTPEELLHQADQIKLANNDEFQNLLQQLDAQADQLNQLQHDWLDYLHAWQLGYRGEYPQALSAFQTLLAHVLDPTLRARARISMIYDQVNATHFEDAYSTVSDLLASLPQISDRNAHFLVLITAAYLYSDAGQYDLALHYIDQAAAYDSSEPSICIVGQTRIETMSKAGKLKPDDARIPTVLDACQRIGDSIDANSIRLFLSNALFDQSHTAEALKLLKAHDAEVLASHSSALTTDYRAAMARFYLASGDLAHAREYAQSAIEHANQQTFAKSVADAYKTLYLVAKKQGDPTAALVYHEKFAAADKGYLNDTSTRALAYQMVHQQVLDKKRQIDALNEQNQMLALQQQVDEKSSETRMLYILLLLSGLAIVALWAYRTKRLQIKFQKLARRDGLTGIFNRQHFFESAQDALRYCARNSREACVLALDLDHFKSVNDMHGHAAGDAALKRVVATCQARLRSIDLFGRLGGEEFAILLPDCNAAVAEQRANEMRTAIAGLVDGDDAAANVVVTASFGVAATIVCGYNLATLLAHADNALYSAKHAGRNRVSVHRAGHVDDEVAESNRAVNA